MVECQSLVGRNGVVRVHVMRAEEWPPASSRERWATRMPMFQPFEDTVAAVAENRAKMRVKREVGAETSHGPPGALASFVDLRG